MRLPIASTPDVTAKRHAFTLVEILVVITIIGILAGILIPAVTSAVRTAKETAVRLEIDGISQALEAYKLEYGAYPPDFSDWKAVERHFRKAFPDIDDDELKLLAQYTHLDSDFDRVPVSASGGGIDPRSAAGFTHYRQAIDGAEALVFCLGGYSGDKKHPFTGEGGPFSLITSPLPSGTALYGAYQYNVARDNAFFDFDREALSTVVANHSTGTTLNPCSAGTGVAYTFSGDELLSSSLAGTSIEDAFATRASSAPFSAIVFLVDPFPVYSIGDDFNPVVYFNAKTYSRTFTPTFETAPGTSSGDWLATANQWHGLNIYMHPESDAELGVARPYLTNQLDTNAGGFLWAEDNRFQLISPGKDRSYGGAVSAGVVDPSDATTASAAGLVSVYPTGQFANAAGTLASGGSQDKYEDDESIYGAAKPQLDNITNFSTRTLESDL